MSTLANKTVKIYCNSCGGGHRNHIIRAEYETHEDDSELPIWWDFKYQVCQCQGCDSFRFRIESAFSEDRDEYGNQHYGVRIFPEQKQNDRKAVDSLQSLEHIGRIYSETLVALNAGAHILAGGGLRAIVEAICIEQKTPGKDLQAKIDSLVERGLLAKPQADLLHEERYIGNAALHEIDPPSSNDLKLGVDIVEGLLNTIYVLPKKAAELRQAREKKSTNKA